MITKHVTSNPNDKKAFNRHNFFPSIFLSLVISVLFLGACSGGGKSSKPCILEGSSSSVTKPPSCLGVNSFYTKYINSQGIPVVSADKVDDRALRRVDEILRYMLNGKTEILDALVKNRARVSVGKINNFDILKAESLPEAKRDDGSAVPGALVTATKNDLPLTIVMENNLLCLQGDPYVGEDISIHELAHMIHQDGIDYVDRGFEKELEGIYNRRGNTWAGTYADTRFQEYLAEGVQTFYEVNPKGSGIDTRQKLKNRDLALHDLIEKHFPTTGGVNPSCSA